MSRLFIPLAALLTLVLAGPMLVAAQDATPEPTGDTVVTRLTRTDVRHFLPYGLDGLNPELTVASEVSGICNIDSLSIPGRPDAWRCFGTESNEIYDPCFTDPFMDPDELGTLACADSPFSTEIVLLTLTEPLSIEKDDDDPDAAGMMDAADPNADDPGTDMTGPAGDGPPQAIVEEADPEHWDLPWALDLANGERCTLLTGATAVLAGDRLNYGCENGGYILGPVDQSGPVWVVSYLADGAIATTLVEVAVAWA